MKKKVKPNYLRHEALHTTAVLLEMIDSHLVDHYYYHSGINPSYNDAVDSALANLSKAYQLCNKDNEAFKKMNNPLL